MYEDWVKNVWVGFDSGIDFFVLNDVEVYFWDNLGELGILYVLIIKEDWLYLGINYGVFYCDFEVNNVFF